MSWRGTIVSMGHDVLVAMSWVQRDSLFLKVVDGGAVLFAALYGIAYFRERKRLARSRRMRSACISSIGLAVFAVFLAVRVFVIHN